MVPTVDEEKSPLLGTQNTRPTTLEMTENPEAEDDRVLRRDRPRALRARRGLLVRHWSIPKCNRDGMDLPPGDTTPVCVTPDAPVVGGPEVSTHALLGQMPAVSQHLPRRQRRRSPRSAPTAIATIANASASPKSTRSVMIKRCLSVWKERLPRRLLRRVLGRALHPMLVAGRGALMPVV